jgi:hypothetical protein
MYAQFIGMKPPTFSKAEDPLEAEAWIKAIEAKFSAFVMPCSEENKANFAALQLREEALMWWDHFNTIQLLGNSGKPVTLEMLSLTKFLRYVFQEQGTHDFRKPGTCEASDSRICEVWGS